MTTRILVVYFLLLGWSQGFTSSRRPCCGSLPQHCSDKNEDRALFSRHAVLSRASKEESRGLLGGYKFGSITKSLLEKASSAIGEATGKEDYNFGDLTKGAVRKFTGKDHYEWGDLTKELKSRGGSAISNFTGKEDYVVGDVSKEIIRKVAEGDYKLEDVLLLFKLLLTFGTGLSPVAGALPVKLLLEMMNYSLATEVGERMLNALATALDERFKEALTGDKGYKIGDLSRKAMLDFIGKTDGEYEFGDISRAISKKVESKDTRSFGGIGSMDPKLLAELERLDDATRQS
jgi:hypothetical protein